MLSCNPINAQFKVKCPLCQKSFVNDLNRQRHIHKYHPNSHLNTNTLPFFNSERSKINNKTSENQALVDFLKDFNLSGDNCTLNSSTISNQDESEDNHSFQKIVTTHLKNNLNFIICLLNINSLLYKFSSIKFILDQGLTDILILN